jgi:hypothetical protein
MGQQMSEAEAFGGAIEIKRSNAVRKLSDWLLLTKVLF